MSPPAPCSQLCEVCLTSPASVVCCSDEAAMCSACDERVHGANLISSKHVRLPFLEAAVSAPPGAKAPRPACDICKQAHALFLCLQDRAYLCRACDLGVHSASGVAQQHERLFLTSARVALHPRPEEPAQPLGRAAALKRRAQEAAQAAQTAAEERGASRPRQHSQGPAYGAPSRPLAYPLPRVPSLTSLDPGSMGDLLLGGLTSQVSLGGTVVSGMGKRIFSLGDLNSLFDGSDLLPVVQPTTRDEAQLAPPLPSKGGALSDEEPGPGQTTPDAAEVEPEPKRHCAQPVMVA